MKENPVEFFNESDLELDSGKHLAAAQEARSLIASDFVQEFGWINVIVIPSKDHTELNINYLGHDYATDILTFEHPEMGVISGEIYINADVLVENAAEYQVAVSNELNRLMVHGILHLAGLDDQTDDEQKVMTLNENKYLEELEQKSFM